MLTDEYINQLLSIKIFTIIFMQNTTDDSHVYIL